MVGSQQQAKRPGSGNDGKKTVSLKYNTGREDVRNVVYTRQNLIKHLFIQFNFHIFQMPMTHCYQRGDVLV